ncbi:MAG: hypothetical protein HYV33_04510 [Candidatus Kerfeldbacteria bacterium]|nr:hypothetical protein [Candidatus Kerfeldbacteria bacterium]
MNYITTTNLRTQSSQLVAYLKKGTAISLIHRSKIIGVIQPIQDDLTKPFNDEKFDRLVKRFNLPNTTSTQRQQRYESHLLKKYGQDIS